jgi:hypothetical protein
MMDPKRMNEPVAEAPAITKRVLEKVRLNVAERLSKVQLAGLASNLKAELIEEHLTHSILVHFQTFLLGANFKDVLLEEEVTWSVPDTWQDHLKESLVHRMMKRGTNRRLRDWLAKRVRYTTYRKRVTKSERVATHLCPHVSVPGDHRGDLVHYAWMDGDVDGSQALKEQLACNGRLH